MDERPINSRAVSSKALSAFQAGVVTNLANLRNCPRLARLRSGSNAVGVGACRGLGRSNGKRLNPFDGKHFPLLIQLKFNGLHQIQNPVPAREWGFDSPPSDTRYF